MDSPSEHLPTDPLAENSLQPFFVLHKESKSSESTARSPGKPSKRRLDSSPKVSLNNENMNENLKMEAFRCVWSKIESKIEDVLRSINADVFGEIGRWVRESFNEICSCRGPVDPSKSSLPYPFVHNGGIVKKLFTGLVFTKNIETVDDILTFAELGLNLKSHGCYVANISSLDFSTKNGIGDCLRAFLRQLLMVDTEAADISLLASWYSDHGKYEKPVVVIIEDMERCSGALLSDFINMLSEWSVKIPIILIAGVATSTDAPRNVLTFRALQYLSTSIFFLKSPAERMDAIIEAVLVKNCAGFSVGHKVATFLRSYFLRQDGTVTSFVRALKMAIVQQLFVEPLSFGLKFLVDEGDNKVHEKIMELESQMVSEDVKSHKAELTDISKDTMQPIECMPFHELICFKDVDNLQSAMVGDPRRKIQIDLLNFYKILKCGCCSNSGGSLSPSMHDTSIMYTLVQEHGDLINLHDWFQSFKASISSSGKKGLKKLASPKKRKDNTYSQNNSDALIQARFCRAVMELQITGLLRMPGKRRPDYVQRVAFGV